jgi:hypothetical protein
LRDLDSPSGSNLTKRFVGENTLWWQDVGSLCKSEPALAVAAVVADRGKERKLFPGSKKQKAEGAWLNCANH